MLASNDAGVLLNAVTQLRRLLSVEVNEAPIAEVIAAGVVPRLIQFLRHDQQPELQFEAAWVLTNIASGASEHARVVVELGAVPLLVQLMRSTSEELCEQATWALGNLAGDSPQLRDHLLHQGVLLALLQAVVETSKLSQLRNATWAISNLCRGKPGPAYDLEVVIDACWALSYLSEGPHDRIQAVIETGACRRLMDLMMSISHAVQTAALRTVGNIVRGDDVQTQHVINLSFLSVLPTLLDSPKLAIRKEACWVLSNITAGTAAHIQAVIDHGFIFPRLVLLLGRSGGVYRSGVGVAVQAAWAVANATSCATPEQIRYLVEQAGFLPQLCALLDHDGTVPYQSSADGERRDKDGSDKLPAIVLEALFNIVRAGAREAGEGGCNRYAVYIKELGALDKVVQLQTHSSDADTRDKAVRLLRCICGNADGADVDMEQGGETSSNAFSFGTFRAALP